MSVRRSLEREVVLDDAVDDDVDAVGGVEVRVGVRLGDAAVRGPARVADAGRAPVGDGDGDRRRLVRRRRAACATASRSLLRLPTARTEAISPSASTETPAES